MNFPAKLVKAHRRIFPLVNTVRGDFPVELFLQVYAKFLHIHAKRVHIFSFTLLAEIGTGFPPVFPATPYLLLFVLFLGWTFDDLFFPTWFIGKIIKNRFWVNISCLGKIALSTVVSFSQWRKSLLSFSDFTSYAHFVVPHCQWHTLHSACGSGLGHTFVEETMNPFGENCWSSSSWKIGNVSALWGSWFGFYMTHMTVYRTKKMLTKQESGNVETL